MEEEVIFVPGNDDTSSNWSNGGDSPVFGLLIDESGFYIIDTLGGRIIINGGFDDGDSDSTVSWQPGMI